MLNELIQTGNRIKIIFLEEENDRKREASYNSKIVEIMDSNKIKTWMPVKNGKYVVLDSLKPYNIEFITRRGMYECQARIVRRFKEKMSLFVVFELMSELEKIQRREYYRLECVFDIKFRRSLDGNIYAKDNEEENTISIKYVEDEQEKQLVYEKKIAPWHAGIVTNISGGGVRFNSREALKKGEKVMLKMHLNFDDCEEDYEIEAKVIHSGPVPKRTDIYEARVQFTNISTRDREAIIRFVFDEERRIRRRKKGLM